MLKNRIWLMLILSIILLIFSINGSASYYKYTQESGTLFYVGIADKADALEDTNEMRQIIDDLGGLLVHSKRDDAYPKNGLFGGTIQIPEAGLKFSNAPVNNDIAAYIAGEMTWQTKAELGLDLSLYYLKTEIDTLSKVEAIYTKNIIDSDELAALKFTDLADTPVAYDNGKYAKSTVDGLVWDTPSGGYTNLTSFVDQTAWRLFYSNNLGDVIELALGTDGQYLKSTGATSAPIFDDPAGAGDMLKATYDSDEDGDIDVAAGGTEKSIWTLYCIPYLSGTTAFGEIPIGTVGQVLKVAAGANSYEFANESDPTVDTDAEIKAILVDEVTKTGDFTANRLPEINNSSGIIEQSDIEHKTNGGYDFNANSAGFTTQTAVGDGTTTCDWRIGLKFRFVFGAGNETFTFTNPEFSCHLQAILIQDGTGGRTATWPANIYWATGTIPTLSTAANARDIVNFFFDDYDDTYYGMGVDFAIP